MNVHALQLVARERNLDVHAIIDAASLKQQHAHVLVLAQTVRHRATCYSTARVRCSRRYDYRTHQRSHRRQQCNRSCDHRQSLSTIETEQRPLLVCKGRLVQRLLVAPEHGQSDKERNTGEERHLM